MKETANQKVIRDIRSRTDYCSLDINITQEETENKFKVELEWFTERDNYQLLGIIAHLAKGKSIKEYSYGCIMEGVIFFTVEQDQSKWE